MSASEIRAKLARARRKEPVVVRPMRSDLTDVGNARRFVREHVDQIRYVGSWGRWLCWDGQRWALDKTGHVDHLAKEMVGRMLSEYASRLASGDESASDGVKWALKSHDAARVRAVVQLARSAPELAIEHGQLDANPWVLNVDNGTIDLRTGKLQRHRPDDLITKLAPVSYDPGEVPHVGAFLNRAMGGNTDLVDSTFG